MVQDSLKIGCGAGFSGDRTDGALPVVKTLIETGGQALIFETLAERTLALSQLAKNGDPDSGYEPLLPELLSPILNLCLQHGIRIVGNFGAANPPAAGRRIRRLAQQLSAPPPRIAVLGGDHLDQPAQLDYLRLKLGAVFDEMDIASINVYQGATEIAQALQAGADIVVAGRVADPSLVLGPALAHFNWELDDWTRLACATMAGHVLECGAQVTGGYFAVPGLKDVPGMDRLGFPIADISMDGSVTITKARSTGGMVTEATVKEQLLYEVHDPAAYLTPDVIADLSGVIVSQTAQDSIQIGNIRGHARPAELKINIFHHGGWLAEAEISYAGMQAEARARLAADTVRKRLGTQIPLRIDLIGVCSILSDDAGHYLAQQPPGRAVDVRLRIAGAHVQREVAERILREVTALYTCGPAGGGGVRTRLTPRLNNVSTTIPRELAPASWQFLE